MREDRIQASFREMNGGVEPIAELPSQKALNEDQNLPKMPSVDPTWDYEREAQKEVEYDLRNVAFDMKQTIEDKIAHHDGKLQNGKAWHDVIGADEAHLQHDHNSLDMKEREVQAYHTERNTERGPAAIEHEAQVVSRAQEKQSVSALGHLADMDAAVDDVIKTDAKAKRKANRIEAEIRAAKEEVEEERHVYAFDAINGTIEKQETKELSVTPKLEDQLHMRAPTLELVSEIDDGPIESERVPETDAYTAQDIAAESSRKAAIQTAASKMAEESITHANERTEKAQQEAEAAQESNIKARQVADLQTKVAKDATAAAMENRKIKDRTQKDAVAAKTEANKVRRDATAEAERAADHEIEAKAAAKHAKDDETSMIAASQDKNSIDKYEEKVHKAELQNTTFDDAERSIKHFKEEEMRMSEEKAERETEVAMEGKFLSRRAANEAHGKAVAQEEATKHNHRAANREAAEKADVSQRYADLANEYERKKDRLTKEANREAALIMMSKQEAIKAADDKVHRELKAKSEAAQSAAKEEEHVSQMKLNEYAAETHEAKRKSERFAQNSENSDNLTREEVDEAHNKAEAHDAEIKSKTEITNKELDEKRENAKAKARRQVAKTAQEETAQKLEAGEEAKGKERHAKSVTTMVSNKLKKIEHDHKADIEALLQVEAVMAKEAGHEKARKGDEKKTKAWNAGDYAKRTSEEQSHLKNVNVDALSSITKALYHLQQDEAYEAKKKTSERKEKGQYAAQVDVEIEAEHKWLDQRSEKLTDEVDTYNSVLYRDNHDVTAPTWNSESTTPHRHMNSSNRSIPFHGHRNATIGGRKTSVTEEEMTNAGTRKLKPEVLGINF